MRPQVPRPDLGHRIAIRCANGSGSDSDLDFGGSGGVWKPTYVIFNYRSYRRATVATLCLPQPLSNDVGIDKKWKRLGLW